MHLYEIKNEYIELLESIEYDAETGEMINADRVEEIEGEFKDKAEAIACYIKDLEAEAEAIKAEQKKRMAKATAKLNKAEYLKGYLKDTMLALEMNKFETDKCEVKFRKSQSVNILNEELIPMDFKKEEITYKVDKTAIKNFIKDGGEVRGAVLETKQNIQIG